MLLTSSEFLLPLRPLQLKADWFRVPFQVDRHDLKAFITWVLSQAKAGQQVCVYGVTN